MSRERKQHNTFAPKNRQQKGRYQPSAQTKGNAHPLTANPHQESEKKTLKARNEHHRTTEGEKKAGRSDKDESKRERQEESKETGIKAH